MMKEMHFDAYTTTVKMKIQYATGEKLHAYVAWKTSLNNSFFFRFCGNSLLSGNKYYQYKIE